MPFGTEDERMGNPIVTQREPKGPKNAKSGKGSIGDVALMDALCIIGACLILSYLIGFSLRRSNI